MGQPVLSREKEMRQVFQGDEKTIHILDLPPEEQEEWAIKYGIDLDKLRNRTTPAEKTEVSEVSEPPKELTKEIYLELKEQRIRDKEIAERFGIGYPAAIGEWKKENGLKGYQMKPNPKFTAVPKERPETENKPTTPDSPVVKELEEALVSKDEQISKYQSLLDGANKARVEAQAKAESLEIELRQYKAKCEPLDLRFSVSELMSIGVTTVQTFAEFQILAEVLGKMKMPWTASHDGSCFNIQAAI